VARRVYQLGLPAGDFLELLSPTHHRQGPRSCAAPEVRVLRQLHLHGLAATSASPAKPGPSGVGSATNSAVVVSAVACADRQLLHQRGHVRHDRLPAPRGRPARHDHPRSTSSASGSASSPCSTTSVMDARARPHHRDHRALGHRQVRAAQAHRRAASSPTRARVGRRRRHGRGQRADALFAVRKRFGMCSRTAPCSTRLTAGENVAFPLRPPHQDDRGRSAARRRAGEAHAGRAPGVSTTGPRPRCPAASASASASRAPS
jgi:hypothetical protein